VEAARQSRIEATESCGKFHQEEANMPQQMTGKSFTVLLVEDSDEDVLLYERAMRKNHFENPPHRVKNGNEAIAYLRGCGA
jgi:hypothetical protein